MTYSLDTLNAASRPKPGPQPAGLARFASEMALVAGAIALGYWLVAMLSYSSMDPAWSTSGVGGMSDGIRTRGSRRVWTHDQLRRSEAGLKLQAGVMKLSSTRLVPAFSNSISSLASSTARTTP